MKAIINGVLYEGMDVILERIKETMAIARTDGIDNFVIAIDGIEEIDGDKE